MLEDFRKMLLSEQPAKKKIHMDIHMKRIFEIGDVIAFQLQTAGKHLEVTWMEALDFNKFLMMDGKYIIMRKVFDEVSWTSCIEPNVKDIWPIFQIYDYFSDTLPDMSDFSKLKPLVMQKSKFLPAQSLVVSEGSMLQFKKRHAVVIGNTKANIPHNGPQNMLLWNLSRTDEEVIRYLIK